MAFEFDVDDNEIELFHPEFIDDEYYLQNFIEYNEECGDWFDFIKTLQYSDIKWIKFGENFNNSIDDLPDDIEYIYFDDASSFKQKVNKYPKNLKKITLWGFSPIINQLPYTLKYLEIHYSRQPNQNIYYDEIINFPPNLVAFSSLNFNMNIDNYNYLPITLKLLYIIFDDENNNTLHLNNLPPGLKYLCIYKSKNLILDCNNLPKSIKYKSINTFC